MIATVQDAILFLFIVSIVFVVMEWVAYITHRYVMRGFLWSYHKDHHQKPPGFFERNDVFLLFFSTPGWAGLALGLHFQSFWITAIGAGVSVYGLAYMWFHELIIHRRLGTLFYPKRGYFLRMVRAHKVHHSVIHKEGATNFGMLVFPGMFRSCSNSKGDHSAVVDR